MIRVGTRTASKAKRATGTRRPQYVSVGTRGGLATAEPYAAVAYVVPFFGIVDPANTTNRTAPSNVRFGAASQTVNLYALQHHLPDGSSGDTIDTSAFGSGASAIVTPSGPTSLAAGNGASYALTSTGVTGSCTVVLGDGTGDTASIAVTDIAVAAVQQTLGMIAAGQTTESGIVGETPPPAQSDVITAVSGSDASTPHQTTAGFDTLAQLLDATGSLDVRGAYYATAPGSVSDSFNGGANSTLSVISSLPNPAGAMAAGRRKKTAAVLQAQMRPAAYSLDAPPGADR